MRALVCKAYGSPDDLIVEDRPDPQPATGEVVIDVGAAGLNFPDMLVIAGQYQVRIPPPFVPGHEAAGVVAAIGDGVDGLDIGDKVMFTTLGGGAFAEKCSINAAHAVPMPPSLNFAQASGFMITYGTSYHALKQRANLQAGETVLVLGAAGGVGVTAVEIAKAMGARVIAAASTEEKLEFASSAGADATINYTETSLRDEVKRITDNTGVDVVYDPVGGELAQQALKSLAWSGRYLVVGFTTGEIPAFPANLTLLKEASIVGVYWGDWAARNPGAQFGNLREMASMIDAGILQPRITATFGLDDFRKAFRTFAERRVLGKIVFEMT
jgi:NADPH2:quinone reductase